MPNILSHIDLWDWPDFFDTPSDSESEFPDLLLVVESGQRSRGSENNRHGGLGSCLDDSRDSGSQQKHTVYQGQLSSVVPVFFDQIT
jgi:hypothetical protein